MQAVINTPEQAPRELDSLHSAIAEAASLLDDMSNEEYIRGMCEMIARLFPLPDVCTDERAEWVEAEVEKLVCSNNAPLTAPAPAACHAAALSRSNHATIKTIFPDNG